jgi:hypothetical protein
MLMRFYGIVEETKLDLDWYSRAIDTSINQKVRLMNPARMIRLLKKILGEIDSASKLGHTLIEALKKIRYMNFIDLTGIRHRSAVFRSASLYLAYLPAPIFRLAMASGDGPGIVASRDIGLPLLTVKRAIRNVPMWPASDSSTVDTSV